MMGSAPDGGVSVKDRALPVIKENKLNETHIQGTLHLKHKSLTSNYSEIVCESCQKELMHVYSHCLESQSKELPSPNDIDEVSDAKRKNHPPFFELLKDPVEPKNLFYTDPGEKIARDLRARKLTKIIEKHQIDTIKSVFEQANLSENNIGSLQAHEETFSGNLYKHVLQLKSSEIGRLREMLLEKTESEQKEVENVRKLRKALSKSMQYYIKAEEWQEKEASLLQHDIRTLKKEMSVLMACLIHAEAEKKDLRNVIGDKEREVMQKENQIKDLEKQVVDTRTKLHDSLKDYIKLNEKIASMARQAEIGNEQAEQRNNILQRNLERLTKEYNDVMEKSNATQKKLKGIEEEMELLVANLNMSNSQKDEYNQENEQLHQDLFQIQTEIQKFMDKQLLDKAKIEELEKKLNDNTESFKTSFSQSEVQIHDLRKQIAILQSVKKEDDATIQKFTSENARLKVSLKEMTQRHDLLDSTVRELHEVRRNEAVNNDKIIIDLEEKVRIAENDALIHQEKREKAMSQLNEAQTALDREMSQNRMLLVEIERFKRDYTELKLTFKNEVDRLNEVKTGLTNDKIALTKHVYDVRQELKEKKEEYNALHLEYKDYQNTSTNKIKGLEETISRLRSDQSELRAQHAELTNQHQALNETHLNLILQHDNLTLQNNETELDFKKLRMDFHNLSIQREELVKEKNNLIKQNNELQSGLDQVTDLYNQSQTSKAAMEKDHKLLSQARENLVNTLSNKVSDLKEEIKKLSNSNAQFREANNIIANDLDLVRKELEETIRLKTLLEEKLDQLRKDLFAEKKLRLEFERMNQKVDRTLSEKSQDQLKNMQNRDKKLDTIDDTMHKDYERLQQVVDIVFSPK
ncbi:hypothetical protein O9G_000731 [Rozella allomycis CSF55]|uniref:Uncharacterized protein n=1 Tax=Rozella allomycis (strain CSF55) TaxID=988480 RepID=A0A075AYD0_ROZAC|nr:hypothetical protein O9G_000731 [Rozella allomycis CSF55]|eukprot:EPZ35335.1 hypothetical protein O9G_000731 [Rozella allomycis CSF55]